MKIRSMTGFSQVKGQQGSTAYTVSLKSVNHRFLDLHLRLPADSADLENRLRQIFKQRLQRGHIEMALTVPPASAGALSVNRELVAGYVRAFRQSAAEFGLSGEPDLNVIFRLNGALADDEALPQDPELAAQICCTVEQAIEKLDAMRVAEGEGLSAELRVRMSALDSLVTEVQQLRSVVLQAYVNKVQSRIQELIGQEADPDRILQEAAILAARSDIQEEVVRMKSHVQHFIGLLDGGGEVGKKLDFLLQEMNREANTMLSKISGVAGEALRMTELGLAMKAEIEKSREQVQNLE